MHTLVFDIETVGESWNDLDTTTQGMLTRWTDRSVTDPQARESALRDIREGLGFSPLTGRIVAIGLYDVERKRGVVYYDSELDTEDSVYNQFILRPRNEAQMLIDFWDGAREYDTFVTFNGRCFDIPFLNLRSVVHGIRPSRDLMEGRYLSQQRTTRHIDLQDQLTFYGAMQRKPSLHLFCRAFGILSPKGEGVTGDDISELFYEKKFRDIAQYNVGDVVATAELYEKWHTYLAPYSHLNPSTHL
jgi:3'-5' exonuclease